MPPLPITVLIPSREDASNLESCLASLSEFDEIYVIDSHSTDSTAAVAKQYGATLVQFSYDGGWPKKKNWAIQNLPLRNDWILILDTDERVTPALVEEMRSAIQSPGVDAYYMRWKFVFLGRWMKHAWSHGWMLRLFRKGCAEYEDLGMRGEGGWDVEVHENLVCHTRTECLQELLLHESIHTLHRWIAKQNDFSDWNAVRRRRQLQQSVPPLRDLYATNPLKRRRLLKAIYIRLPFRPALMFLYLYIMRAGFLDGPAGYHFCLLRAMHEANIDAKRYAMDLGARADEKHT